MIELVPLTTAHLAKLPTPKGLDTRSYFTPGSVAFCLLADGEPVFAGGIVNLQWERGEAWMLPTPYFRSHLKTCFHAMKSMLPFMADEYGFRRVQATCIAGQSSSLFRNLGFFHEGSLARYGPNGERCDMYCMGAA